MTVIIKLKKLRESHPATPSQRTLGDVIGVAEANYRRLENGRAKSITFEAIDKLCAFFDCTPNDIIDFKKDSGNKEVA